MDAEEPGQRRFVSSEVLCSTQTLLALHESVTNDRGSAERVRGMALECTSAIMEYPWALTDILTHCQGIETIRVSPFLLDSDPRIVRAICELPKLQYLQVENALEARNLNAFLANLRSSNLTELSLDYELDYKEKHWEGEEEKDPLRFLHHCARSLVTIKLGAVKLSPLDAHTLQYPNVTTLLLPACAIPNIDVLMYSFPNLRQLMADYTFDAVDNRRGRASAVSFRSVVRVEPWKMLEYIEGIVPVVRDFEIPCPVRFWRVTDEVDFQQNVDHTDQALLATLKKNSISRLQVDLDLTSEDNIVQMLPTASELCLTHLSVNIGVQRLTIIQTQRLVNIIIELARTCGLQYLRLALRSGASKWEPARECTPEILGRREELGRTMQGWNHAAIASRFFTYAPSLRFFALTCGRSGSAEEECWMAGVRSLTGAVMPEALSRSQARLHTKKEGMNWPPYPNTFTDVDIDD